MQLDAVLTQFVVLANIGLLHPRSPQEIKFYRETFMFPRTTITKYYTLCSFIFSHIHYCYYCYILGFTPDAVLNSDLTLVLVQVITVAVPLGSYSAYGAMLGESNSTTSDL